jgi:hypothetical protein
VPRVDEHGRKIVGTRVPKADAVIIIVRRTRIHPCLPRRTIRRVGKAAVTRYTGELVGPLLVSTRKQRSSLPAIPLRWPHSGTWRPGGRTGLERRLDGGGLLQLDHPGARTRVQDDHGALNLLPTDR